MASCMEWHQPVQEEADWLRLLLVENEVGIIAKTATFRPSYFLGWIIEYLQFQR